MILVTLGTQDKTFVRLLEAIQKQVDAGNIKEEIIVQAGYTKFKSKDMKIFELISMDEFDNLIKRCDLLITHGGVGSIITGLKNNKKVIAAARLEKYGEHTNDHQLQIIENFTKAGYILPLDDFEKLDEVLKKVKNFEPKKYKSNSENMQRMIKDYIDNNPTRLKIASKIFFLFFIVFIICVIVFLINY